MKPLLDGHDFGFSAFLGARDLVKPPMPPWRKRSAKESGRFATVPCKTSATARQFEVEREYTVRTMIEYAGRTVGLTATLLFLLFTLVSLEQLVIKYIGGLGVEAAGGVVQFLVIAFATAYLLTFVSLFVRYTAEAIRRLRFHA